MHIHIFIKINIHIYINIYIYTVFLKKMSLLPDDRQGLLMPVGARVW
jgi:hypothetical protein